MENKETDFRKWLAFSSCASNHKNAIALFNALERKRSVDGFTFNKSEPDTNTYTLSESGNSKILVLNEASYKEALLYIADHYVDKKTLKNGSIKLLEHTAEIKNLKPQYRQKEILREDPIGDKLNRVSKEPKVTNNFLKILGKISHPNKFRHTLNFSLANILFLQLVILPAYLGGVNFGSWINFGFIILITLISYLSIWTYSNLYYKIKDYWSIFKFTMVNILFVFIFLANEVLLLYNFGVDAIMDNFLVLVGVNLIFILSGLFIGMICTVAVYLINGGKWVILKKGKS